MKGTERRFLSKLIYIPKTGCLEWSAAKDKKTGYGRFWFDGKTGYAHIYSYTYWTGFVSFFDREVDHLCKNKKCCAPDHLESVTISTNQLRNYNADFCPNGHSRMPENRSVYRNGQEVCRLCVNDTKRRQRSQKRKES